MKNCSYLSSAAVMIGALKVKHILSGNKINVHVFVTSHDKNVNVTFTKVIIRFEPLNKPILYQYKKEKSPELSQIEYCLQLWDSLD